MGDEQAELMMPRAPQMRKLHLPLSYGEIPKLFKKLQMDEVINRKSFDRLTQLLPDLEYVHYDTVFDQLDLSYSGVINYQKFCIFFTYLNLVAILHSVNFSCDEIYDIIDVDGNSGIDLSEFDQFISNLYDLDAAPDELHFLDVVKDGFESLIELKLNSGMKRYWVVAFFEKKFYKQLGKYKHKIHISRVDFQYLLERDGFFDVYSANEKFREIDYSNDGFIDVEEIAEYAEKKGTSPLLDFLR